MFCDSSPLVVYVMRGVLILCGVLVIVLMQRAEHDKSIKRVDSRRLMNIRRIAFIAIAGGDAALMITLNPWALITLFALTAILLAVDILGLGQRPSDTGHKVAPMRSRALRHISVFFRDDRDTR
jgi:putative exporter of polyketide antibiotics